MITATSEVSKIQQTGARTEPLQTSSASEYRGLTSSFIETGLRLADVLCSVRRFCHQCYDARRNYRTPLWASMFVTGWLPNVSVSKLYDLL
jgi:hypothetical protein